MFLFLENLPKIGVEDKWLVSWRVVVQNMRSKKKKTCGVVGGCYEPHGGSCDSIQFHNQLQIPLWLSCDHFFHASHQISFAKMYRLPKLAIRYASSEWLGNFGNTTPAGVGTRLRRAFRGNDAEPTTPHPLSLSSFFLSLYKIN